MSAVSRLRRRQPLRGGDRHIRSGISCCGFSAPHAIRRAVACGHGNASATRVGGGRLAIPPFAPRGPGRWSDAGHRSVLTPIGRPSRDRAAAAAVAGHGTSGRMIDHSVNWRHGTPAGRGHLFGQRSRALPRAPQRVRGALAALGAGALVRRSPSFGPVMLACLSETGG